MTVQIETHGGGFYTVQGKYEEIREQHAAALAGADDGATTSVYEVTLGDGMYAPLGTKAKLLVNPHGVATIRDLDGYAPDPLPTEPDPELRRP